MISINGIKIEVNYFPAGEQRIILPDYDTCINSLPEINIQWNYENDEELVSLYYIKRQLDEVYGSDMKYTLSMPYCPNARMDRIKDKREVFTLKYFSEIINLMNFDIVYIENPHSDVCMGLLNKVEQNKYDANRIEDLLYNHKITDKIDVLFYPDSGCTKKYDGVISYPYLVGHKSRDWETGKIKDFKIIGDIPEFEFNVLIVDDICSKGGTFYHAAKALKELGAKNIYLYITHCENTILDGELIKSGLIKKIYTTGSIYTESNELIEVV